MNNKRRGRKRGRLGEYKHLCECGAERKKGGKGEGGGGEEWVERVSYRLRYDQEQRISLKRGFKNM